MRRDLGDFQTPPALVDAVLHALGCDGARWPRVLEPTCGRGEFVAGLLRLAAPPREIHGIEVQEDHAAATRSLSDEGPGARLGVLQANLFDLDLRRDVGWVTEGALLIVGNPPWVTNSALGALGSDNGPRKSNIKQIRGLDARTGASNFDIAEAVWLKLIHELADEQPTIALLCKTSVARNVLQYADRAELPVANASVRKIDASIWFRASVDACLFRVELGPGPRVKRIPIFSALDSRTPAGEWGLENGRLVSDGSAYRQFAFADGTCPLEWRQGLKHDASAVMVLGPADAQGVRRNKRGEPVVVEEEHLYPLLKGSDLARAGKPATSRSVIVTQRKVGQNTGRLEHEAPKLWSYLTANHAVFANRKSAIYKEQPPFAMFGIGPYSFSPFKVAVSGLHKSVRIRALGPEGERPVMLDDTCYFLPCSSPEQAAVVAALLNSPAALGLIQSLMFADSKRPITKGLLQRINLDAILKDMSSRAVKARAEVNLSALLGAPANGSRIAHWCEPTTLWG